MHYGGAAVKGDVISWNNTLIHGIIPGDTLGNISVSMHLLLAAIITFGGPIQLIPEIRSRFPKFHHWNGRIYIFTAILISLGGLHMVMSRGIIGGPLQHLGIVFNGLLIILCALQAIRYAMQRKITDHRRWALRLFLVVSGVWFFRIGLMFWTGVNQGPVGWDPETFTGPFLNFLSFGQTLLPLFFLQIYFWAQKKAGTYGRFTVASGIFFLTTCMCFGIFVATMGMWLPQI